MEHRTRFWAVALLAVVLFANTPLAALADGPSMSERTTAERVAEVDARVAATVARIEGLAAIRKAASWARVEARLAEIWATRTCPVLPPAAGTWRSIVY